MPTGTIIGVSKAIEKGVLSVLWKHPVLTRWGLVVVSRYCTPASQVSPSSFQGAAFPEGCK